MRGWPNSNGEHRSCSAFCVCSWHWSASPGAGSPGTGCLTARPRPTSFELSRQPERRSRSVPPCGSVGLSLSRYHAWKRAERARGLTDRPSCPKTFPSQLTAREVATIREMATADEYRHVPTSTLAVLAQRLGRVFASASTWSRLVRTRGWQRPRTWVYPAKPKVGLRATKPNEYWHIDVTVIRLLDDFSRRILAWHLAEKLSPLTTCNMLAEAAKLPRTPLPAVSVITDTLSSAPVLRAAHSGSRYTSSSPNSVYVLQGAAALYSQIRVLEMGAGEARGAVNHEYPPQSTAPCQTTHSLLLTPRTWDQVLDELERSGIPQLE